MRPVFKFRVVNKRLGITPTLNNIVLPVTPAANLIEMKNQYGI